VFPLDRLLVDRPHHFASVRESSGVRLEGDVGRKGSNPEYGNRKKDFGAGAERTKN